VQNGVNQCDEIGQRRNHLHARSDILFRVGFAMTSNVAPAWLQQGRALRDADGVCVSLYDVPDEVMAQAFAGASLKGVQQQHRAVAPGTVVVPTAQGTVVIEPPRPIKAGDAVAALLQQEQDAADEDDPSSDSDQEQDFDADDGMEGPFAQLNGSSYRVRPCRGLPNVEGVGVCKALRSVAECRAPHAVLMLSAGRFAGCIFGEDGLPKQHKTFKRYTVRAKQGGGQSAHDEKGRQAKSAGSNIRRYNESRLEEEIGDLLNSWRQPLQGCAVILASVAPQNRRVIFDGEHLKFSDPRVRRIPFAGVGRPSLESCVRAHSLVCGVLMLHSLLPEKERPATPPPAPVPTEASQTEADKPDASAVEEEKPLPELHAAAEAGNHKRVLELLRGGSDPTEFDSHLRVPYFLAKDSATRDAFRWYRGEVGEDKWDWKAARVDEAITQEMLDQRKEAQKEKDKLKRQRAKERKKQEKAEQEQSAAAEEARRKADEAAQAGAPCAQCGKGSGPKGFHANGFTYCTTTCVQAHKRVLAAEAAAKRFG